MGNAATFISRLRVLVARTYRAEKLYSSIRNSQQGNIANLSLLSDMANDLRAKEWQRSHFHLRTTLNELLSAGNQQKLLEGVIALKFSFLEKADESEASLQTGLKQISDVAKRQEFAHVLKLSMELIQLKSRTQACRAIVSELQGVLDASGKNAAEMAETSEADVLSEQLEKELEYSSATSKVIPFSRRTAAGGRFGR